MKSLPQWKRQVCEAAEKKNKEKLLEECYKKERGTTVEKSKTRTLIPILENAQYKRQPHSFIVNNGKLKARAFIMGRYGMLQCAANFSNGYGGKSCKRCKVEDNEQHRMNECPEWRGINRQNQNEPMDYNMIYSDDERSVSKVVERIISMWDLGNNKNSMRPND